MKLKDTQIKSAKPREKAYKLFDGDGLYLFITPSGSKYWRLKYRFNGKEKKLALGVYDKVSLADAREKKNDAKKLLDKNIDPGENKKAQKLARQNASANSFEVIAREWHHKFITKWTPKHADRILSQLNNDIFPWLGSKPISEINAPQLLTTLQRVEARGAIETAHRSNQICSQVFLYAIATGRAERNPAADLRGALPPVKKKHFASITDKKEIGQLLRSIDGYEGFLPTRCALQLAPLLFVRPGELRTAEWREFDLDNAIWRIPADKMKMRLDHLIPLPIQAIKILHELKPLTGDGKYLFPSVRTNSRPISNNTLNAGLRRLGYTKEQLTSHGFRAMASTLLNENGWNRDAIERQLSHTERNKIRAAYNRAEYLDERREMMQWWAEFLDALKKLK